VSKYFFVLLTIGMTFHGISNGQDYFRIKGDFSVKISINDSTRSLTKGIVYYDKNIKDLIYDISFPKIEKWISKDTSLYKVNNDSLYQRVTIPSINEFTVFHLSLNAGLNDFGLKNSIYKINKVEKKGDLVLSYYKIPEKVNILIDHVVIAKRDNRLESVIMVGEDQKILSKQFFRNYIKIDAFEFPQQIIQVLYTGSGDESYQVTDFRNVKINDMTNSKLYQINLKKYE